MLLWLHFLILSFDSTIGRIETKVWMKYSQEIASEPVKYKEIIDVGEFDLRRKRSPSDDVNPFTIKHPMKSEDLATLEKNLNRIKSRYETINDILNKGRDERSTFDANLDYIQQLLEENDIDGLVEEAVGDGKLQDEDFISGEKFATAFRNRRSFYHDQNIKDEAYRRLKSKCDSKMSFSCSQKLFYFNASLESLKDDASKKIIKIIMMEVVSHFVAAVGLCLTVVNFLKILKVYRKLFGKGDQTENRENENNSINEIGNHDEGKKFTLPMTVHDVQSGKDNYEEDIKLLLQIMELKKLNKTASKKKPFLRKCLRMILLKGPFF